MNRKLPARPNLDHLRRQAKTLLAALHDGRADAADFFIAHLPDARRMSAAGVRAAGFRLADAQSVVARRSGFASWPALSRHVQQLRGLQGEWQFTSLEIDAMPMPASALTQSRLLLDGDRFRSESPEATYEGIFSIDVEASPAHIDTEFVDGPEAGNVCHGIYEIDGDRLTLCLGLVGSSRPTTFTTTADSGHALERLHRVSAARPADVTGGTPPRPTASEAPREDPAAFDVVMTPALRRLEGQWVPLELIRDGKALPAQWLSFGSRTAAGNEVRVVFGGQTMLHAKMRIDERSAPIAVDYLNLDGTQAGTISRGVMEWIGDDVRFAIAVPGEPRPSGFDGPLPKGTISRWKRRA